MIHVTRILYPTDFSSYSNQAYFHAVGLAETYGASLTVGYVHTPGSPGDRAHWQNQLEQVRPANPNIPVSHVLLEGDPATEIARYAADAAIDVIVIGTHGRTGVDRLMLGSVAERSDAQSAVFGAGGEAGPGHGRCRAADFRPRQTRG